MMIAHHNSKQFLRVCVCFLPATGKTETASYEFRIGLIGNDKKAKVT